MLRDTNLSRDYERFVTVDKIVKNAIPIATIRRYVDPGVVEGTLDFHLTRLIESLNLKWNIQTSQIKQIVEDLIDKYQYESLEDFILIFKRARQGEFGELYRLDSAVIFGWMERYLDEKYEVTERLHKTIKAKEKVVFPEVGKEVQEEVKQFTEGLKATMKAEIPLTEQDIREEGQEKPKRKPYSTIGLDEVVTMQKMKIEYARECTDLITGIRLNGKPSFDEWLLLNHPPF